MRHTCHAPGCSRTVPPKMFACLPHWRQVPSAVQKAIWREYRPGQERDKDPSARYLAVVSWAQAQLAFKPHDEEAAALVVPYLRRTLLWQARAVEAGGGDPLEGLGFPT